MAKLIANVIKGKLIIEVPVNEPLVLSKSGKTMLVASSHGNQKTNAEVDGKQITIGLNAYVNRG